MGVRVGDKAPDFELASQDGSRWRLADNVGESVLVVFFYPKDETPGCTRESCAFRDQHDIFVDKGAQVVGISSDSVASHQAFADRLGLPYTLLADVGGKVRKRWGVPKTLGIMPGRVTYVIDRQGVVRHLFKSQMDVLKHVDEALASVERLAAEG